MFATMTLSCAGLADAWLPPIPAPPEAHHEERLYELAWSSEGNDGEIPEFFSGWEHFEPLWDNLLTGVPMMGHWMPSDSAARVLLADRDDKHLEWAKQLMLTTRHVEIDWTVRQMMSHWLDHAYFGETIFGIGPAAEHYFDLPLEALSDPQLAMLVALSKRPSERNPHHRLEKLLPAAESVLRRAGEPLPVDWSAEIPETILFCSEICSGL